jgi:hypothetical protein
MVETSRDRINPERGDVSGHSGGCRDYDIGLLSGSHAFTVHGVASHS